jgi:hypothetical protein
MYLLVPKARKGGYVPFFVTECGQVSDINKGLDEQVKELRSRPLASEYPILWVDAVYERIQDNGRVISGEVLVIKGINLEGYPATPRKTEREREESGTRDGVYEIANTTGQNLSY